MKPTRPPNSRRATWTASALPPLARSAEQTAQTKALVAATAFGAEPSNLVPLARRTRHTHTGIDGAAGNSCNDANSQCVPTAGWQRNDWWLHAAGYLTAHQRRPITSPSSPIISPTTRAAGALLTVAGHPRRHGTGAGRPPSGIGALTDRPRRRQPRTWSPWSQEALRRAAWPARPFMASAGS